MAEDFNSHNFYAKLKEEKQLFGVKCNKCGHLSPEPRLMCPKCHESDMSWHQFSGKAKLSTFTCISVVPVLMGERGFGRDRPYCSGIVSLEEGPRISALINGVDGNNPQDIKTGMDLVLDLEGIDIEFPALAFKPA